MWLAALAAFAALAYAGPAGAHAGSETPVEQACDEAGAYLTQGRLATARDAYLKALTKPAAPCVVSGLVAVYAAVRREAAYCAAGDAFAKAGEDDEARRQYAQAVMQNTSSDCGLEGLGASSGSKSFWDRSRDGAHRFVDYLPSFPIQLGSLLLMVVFAIGVLALIRSAVLRKASLVVRPFEDKALDQRVGSAFSGLVEEQLVRFWQTRQRARDDGYNLDLVVANVELLAQDESLGDAVGELAQVPQLGLLAAVLSFIDRVFLQRRLSVAGELLPEGANGCGVALSLFKRKHLEARGTVWERLPAAATGDSSAATAAPAATPPADAPPTMSRYYGLAGHAAAWVQYQASRVLDDRVGLITSNAESFSELSAGIDEHRTAAGEEEDADASKHYDEAAQRYDHALKFDRENVAALVNLALVRARHLQSEEPIAEQPDSGKAMVEKPASEDATATKPDSEEAIPNKPAFEGAIAKLAQAGTALDRRYAETAPRRKAIPKRQELADPTWYRIRYGIASQQLHAGQFEDAAETARQLVNSTCAVLTEIGWRWANHTPTYFTSWYKRFPAWLWRVVRRIGRRARRRSVLGDWELARFLARTVEPAAVVVWASALVEDGKTAMVLQKTDHVPPLDRRKKDFDPSQEDNAWLASYLDELLAVNSNQAEKPEQARECKQAGESTQSKRPLLERLKLLVKDLIGSLGASRWRPPDKLNARVHYNLACFFSRLAKRDDDESKEAHLNLSAMHLTCCLAGEWGPRRGESRHWARRDPGLDALNDTDRFEEIVGRELTSAGVKVDVSSPAHIALRNAAVITGWVLALVGLVAILLAVFPGIPFT